MSNKQYYNTDEALKFILEPGSDSKIEVMDENDDKVNTSNIVPKPRIVDDKIMSQILMHPMQQTNLKLVKTRVTMTITNNQ